MKTLVIGDIHGCLSTLKALIAKAGPVDQIINKKLKGTYYELKT